MNKQPPVEYEDPFKVPQWKPGEAYAQGTVVEWNGKRIQAVMSHVTTVRATAPSASVWMPERET